MNSSNSNPIHAPACRVRPVPEQPQTRRTFGQKFWRVWRWSVLLTLVVALAGLPLNLSTTYRTDGTDNILWFIFVGDLVFVPMFIFFCILMPYWFGQTFDQAMHDFERYEQTGDKDARDRALTNGAIVGGAYYLMHRAGK